MACQSALWYKCICLGGIIYVRPWCEKIAIIVLWSDPKSSYPEFLKGFGHFGRSEYGILYVLFCCYVISIRGLIVV